MFTVCNFLAPPIIQLIGVRWSLVVAASTYAAFQAGFLFLNEPYLYTSSALLGLGAASGFVFRLIQFKLTNKYVCIIINVFKLFGQHREFICQ
jgi:hypothetical protein